MTRSSLGHWLQRLEQLHPRDVELGLERVGAVARSMRLLPVEVPVVTVAGTNGKGSVVAVMEAVLNAAGYTTGVFTSPHLQRFNERIRVGGAEVADTDIVEAFAAIDAARGDVSLTYFEFAALAALYVFRAAGPDVVILEVGLGGRLDAVNIVDPDVAVITSIDIDHSDWLGDTREEIALEKAGILRRGVPAVVADPDPPASLAARIRELGAAPALFIGRDFYVDSGEAAWSARLVDGAGHDVVTPPLPATGLLAANVAAALQATLLLDAEIDFAALPRVVAGVCPAGRRQVVEAAGREYLLDVAHNPAAVEKLLEYIDINYCNKKKIAIFSAMKDKDIEGMLGHAQGRFDAWFLADQPDNPRAVAAVDVAALLHARGERMISVSDNLRQALRRAQQVTGPGDLAVVFGSFFTVAGTLPALERDCDRAGVAG